MIRNMKALGLALVALFALSAIGASAASAQKGLITSPTSPVWLSGKDEVATKPQLRAFEGATECHHATYTGGKVNATNKQTGHHEGLSNGSVDFTITPTYTECRTSTGLPETITMNGCDYVIHNGTTKAAGEYNVTADLVCPPGQEVTIDIWFSHERHTTLPPDCVIHIPPGPNQGLHGGTLRDEPAPSNHLTLGGTITDITMTLTDPACGGPVTTDKAELDLEATIEGRSAATGGVAVPLSLSHKG